MATIIKTLAELKTRRGTANATIDLIGRNNATDGLAGGWYWDDTATDAPDDNQIVQVTGVATGRWKRLNGLAPAGLTPRGAWVANTAYAANDIVTNGGNTYRRLSAGTSGASFDPAMWEVLAAKGDTGEITKAALDSAISGVFSPPTVDGYLYRAKNNNLNLVQPCFAFDLSAIAWSSGASFTFSCKIVSKSGNIVSTPQIRTFWNSVTTINDITGPSLNISKSTTLPANQTISYTVIGTTNFAKTSYVHVFLDVMLSDGTLASELLIYDAAFTIAGGTGVKLPGSDIYRANGTDTITAVTALTEAAATKTYVDQKKVEALAYTDAVVGPLKSTPVVANRYIGVANTVNPTLMQPIVVFDTNGIDWAVNDTVAFTCKLISRSGNITNIATTRVFINDVSALDSTSGSSGNMGSASASPVTGTALVYTATRAAAVKARYIHVYIDVTLTAPTTPTTFDIYDATLTVKGVPTVRVTGSALYMANANDTVTSFSYFDDQLANVGYVNTQRDAAKAYADSLTTNKLKGKKWNALGDSITYGHGVGVNGTYRAILATRWGMTARNYGISGTCLAGTSNSFGASMATRYGDMDADADYITVFGGTNDWSAAIAIGTNADTVVDTFKGALNVLCKGLIEKYPTKKIGFITPLNHRTATNSGGLSVLNYVDATIEICALWAIPVLDLYRRGGILPINATQRGSVMYDSNNDGIGDDVQHPGAVGHAILADRIEAFLLTL
ncbi:lysophospholipase L1-like esterase [Spirosoma oryzae]|uniref:Lysophospholipase L1-like esterase n=1 Tax=Spirosoma oryzae TaxID=1469603 RepID=A0A2T0S8Q3_9BACT|nr:GDSL-type esterase/lipase family protein [Spirosoma oryzae]PRY29814.1 lysophospholipase L1-like esterase [Spirosoma oryzae]